VRKHRLDLAILFVLATLVGAYLALSKPAYQQITIHVYVLVVGGLTMLGIVLATSDTIPRRRGTELDRALDERESRDKPVPELDRIEREVSLATASSYDLHTRLLPHLRAIATARLERRGRSPGPDTLGQWWELLRPDRTAPDDRFSPGLPAADLRRLVDELERI